MNNNEYVVAIPTFNRVDEIIKKTLTTLKNGNVIANKIHLFVANEDEYEKYKSHIPTDLYHKIIIGVIGIVAQRNFIVNYFEENQYIVSMDDDVEGFYQLAGYNQLTILNDLDTFFTNSFVKLQEEHLFIFGIYPVKNPFFLRDKITTDFRFIIGATYGFINRHCEKLKTTVPEKEDYELSILYFLKDGGVLRHNNICVKTKFMSVGGLGEINKRMETNKTCAELLIQKYPQFVASIFQRKNGMAQIRLKKMKK